jgi:hypothetical protein
MDNKSIEAAKWYVDQCIRDINACTNYVMMPLLNKMLANAQEELAYQVATNR